MKFLPKIDGECVICASFNTAKNLIRLSRHFVVTITKKKNVAKISPKRLFQILLLLNDIFQVIVSNIKLKYLIFIKIDSILISSSF